MASPRSKSKSKSESNVATDLAALFDPSLPPGFIRVVWWRGGDRDSGPDIISRVWSDPVIHVNQVVYVSEGLVDRDGNGRLPEEPGVKLARVTNLRMASGHCILTSEPRVSLLQRIADEQRRLRELQG